MIYSTKLIFSHCIVIDVFIFFPNDSVFNMSTIWMWIKIICVQENWCTMDVIVLRIFIWMLYTSSRFCVT